MNPVLEQAIEYFNSCDKCGKPVPPTQDAVILDALQYGEPLMLLFNQPRHITCSPSRAQYICHPDFKPVVDERKQYDKRLLDESTRYLRELDVTAAWDKLQWFVW
jgi:hypothetical protein